MYFSASVDFFSILRFVARVRGRNRVNDYTTPVRQKFYLVSSSVFIILPSISSFTKISFHAMLLAAHSRYAAAFAAVYFWPQNQQFGATTIIYQIL